MNKTVKFSILGGVVLSAIGYLAYAGMKEGWVQYHVTVDAFVQNTAYQNRRVRLAGTVSPEGLISGAGKLGAQFTLSGRSEKVRVDYGGIVPDLFKAGGEVVVEGKSDPAGTFKADLLLTRCASKYEGQAPHGEPNREEKP